MCDDAISNAPKVKRKDVTCSDCQLVLQKKNLSVHYIRHHGDILSANSVNSAKLADVTKFLHKPTIQDVDAYISDTTVHEHAVVQAAHGRPSSKRGTGLNKKNYFVPKTDHVFLALTGTDKSKTQNLIGYVRWKLDKSSTTFLQILQYLANQDNVEELYNLLTVDGVDQDEDGKRHKLHGM